VGQTAPVVVDTKKPTCDSFVASPVAIKKGEGSMLTWTTTHADEVSIARFGGNTTKHDVDGSQRVTPAQTFTFVLTAKGKGGSTNCSATVKVVDSVVATSTAGQVRGVSIDLYGQLGAALEALSAYLRTFGLK
jgi:hypothetical protein